MAEEAVTPKGTAAGGPSSPGTSGEKMKRDRKRVHLFSLFPSRSIVGTITNLFNTLRRWPIYCSIMPRAVCV